MASYKRIEEHEDVHKSDAIQKFIQSQDLSLLETPLEFGKQESFVKYQCCIGAFSALASQCVSAIFCPIGTFKPSVLFKHYGLQLDNDAVRAQWAINDCCCHEAITQKTVPLEKIQDVELTTNCVLTCFGLKQVNIQTAGMGTQGPEVAAAWLSNPEQARDAIQLAVKLYRARSAAPLQQGAMRRGGGGGAAAPATPANGSLADRLLCLEHLVSRGVLTPNEALSVRVKVLLQEHDTMLRRLGEAADLRDRGQITQPEFWQFKAGVMGVLQDVDASFESLTY